MGVQQLLISRHAETEYNVDGLVNGDPTQQVHLTERGRQQAAHLRESLRDVSIDLCVTTEFLRTKETADIVLRERPVPRLVLRELNDPRVGAFEGRAFEDFVAWRQAHDRVATEPDGAESLSEVLRRYCSGFRLLAERPESTALVIAHALPVSIALLAVSAEEGAIPSELPEALPAEVHAIDVRRLLTGLIRIVRPVDKARARDRHETSRGADA